MSPAFESVISNEGGDDNSSRVQTAGGLMEHFAKTKGHRQLMVNDGYQMPVKFDITTKNTGVYQGPRHQQASAELLNELLKDNQANYHLYFTETGGFHNHRVHHLLAAYSLGATPEELQLAHDTMEDTQRPRYPIDENSVKRMYDTKGFKSMLGDDKHYHDYLAFFWQKFETNGWKEVLTEYLFSGTELANDLFVRLFAGIWHNLILVGYGVEFEQPGIVAEGLAGACVHSDVFGIYLLECEKLAKASSAKCKPLVTLLQEIRSNPALCDKDHWKGGNSFAYADEVVSNAPPGLSELASQWKVDNPHDLPFRTVELINVNAFIAGAAQRPNKAVKIDFIFIHHINASIFFSAFLQQDWMSAAAKTRILEWYTRLNLLFYAASLGPKLLADEVTNYKPREPKSTWSTIIQRCLVLPDDGHLPKIIRALAHGERVSQPWERSDENSSKPVLPVKGTMWLQIANMAIDSAESEHDLIKRWVRGAGSDEAWAEVPDRSDRS